MPNWVLNKVYFDGNKKDVERLKNFVRSEDSEFDFNNIVPMPESLKMDSGSTTNVAMAFGVVKRLNGKDWKQSTDFRNLISTYADRPWMTSMYTYDEWADLGEKYLSNKEKYGHSTWYDWCCDKWGTKWNSCEESWNDNEVTFSTAWSMPEPIFEKLAELFPRVTIEVMFADEDLGRNCGQAKYNVDEPGNNWVDYVDTLEFACDVWGYDIEEIRSEYDE